MKANNWGTTCKEPYKCDDQVNSNSPLIYIYEFNRKVCNLWFEVKRKKLYKLNILYRLQMSYIQGHFLHSTTTLYRWWYICYLYNDWTSSLVSNFHKWMCILIPLFLKSNILKHMFVYQMIFDVSFVHNHIQIFIFSPHYFDLVQKNCNIKLIHSKKIFRLIWQGTCTGSLKAHQ